MRTRRIGALALTAVLGLLALVTPARADPWWTNAPAPAPSLANVSATTQTPLLFTVTGQDFTPGGRVYLAIYDQMGAQLYENRSITASSATTVMRHQAGDGALGRSPVAVGGGTLREAFANLCGATAMMRARDGTTTVWSNWLMVEPTCGVEAFSPH